MENSTLLTWSMMRTKALWNELFIIHSFSVAEFFFLKHIFYSFEKVCNAIYYFYCKKNSIRKEFVLTPSILFSSLKVIGKEWSYKPLAACGWFLRWPGFFFFFLIFTLWWSGKKFEIISMFTNMPEVKWSSENSSGCCGLRDHLRTLSFRLIACKTMPFSC